MALFGALEAVIAGNVFHVEPATGELNAEAVEPGEFGLGYRH